METSALFVFLIFILIIGLYIIYLIREKPKKTNGKGSPALSPAKINEKWLEIQEMIRQGGPANFRQAIVEADKLVDMVLRSRVSGDSMGERLRFSKKLFEPTTYNNLWTAHKLRNKVVHEAEFEGLSYDAKTAIKYFEKALKELGVI